MTWRTLLSIWPLAMACSTGPSQSPPCPGSAPNASTEAHPDPNVRHEPEASDGVYAIRAARVIDGVSDTLRENLTVLVRGNKIAAVGRDLAIPKDATVIELGDQTLLPGFIDVHTHILAEGSEDGSSEAYERELYRRSTALRALVASRSARLALSHGFTSLRDVCTEGAMYADADLKRAINRGLVAGPRLWVSTRGMTSTGNYVPTVQSWELALPKGTEICDGADACRKAVRSQISHGADWIKVFADWDRNNFTAAELGAIVDEAHRRGRKVAAHATTKAGILAALDAGVDSIEHGGGIDDSIAKRMTRQHVYFSPTLMVIQRVFPDSKREKALAKAREQVRLAYRAGVKIVLGTDIGVFPWTHSPAREFALMQSAGMSAMDAIRSGTSIPAEMLGAADRLGHIAPGKLADLVAVWGNPLEDLSTLEHPRLVMKDGRIFRRKR